MNGFYFIFKVYGIRDLQAIDLQAIDLQRVRG